MENNITRGNIKELITFLDQEEPPILTNASPKIKEFEDAWTEWLGCKYSLFVNSGASANELTMLGLKYHFGDAEVIVPPLTWCSDFYSVIRSGLTPVVCDINLKNLSFDLERLKKAITPKTKAIFVTHVLGLNALSLGLLKICEDNGLLLIEDVAEAHGTTFMGKKVGAFGFASNFSFFFAHHMSTIEGGMICTNNERFYQWLRCFRSHGMLRESTCPDFKKEMSSQYPDLNQDFIFLAPAFNMRSTAINAVLGLSQLKDLDANNVARREKFEYFIRHLDKSKYFTDFEMKGQCAYSFNLILKTPNNENWAKVENALRSNLIEFRRGLSGGGSQLKQPYFKEYLKEKGLTLDESQFPVMEHVHFNSCYLGLYPTLEKSKIDNLLRILNSLDIFGNSP